MAFREPSVSELLKAAGAPDRRRKYPFDKWERIHFQKYVRRFNVRAVGRLSKKRMHWAVVYQQYKNYMLTTPKKFRMILPPKTFIAMLRYFFRTTDEKRNYFAIRHSGKIGRLSVKEAKEKNKASDDQEILPFRKNKQPQSD